MKIRMHAVEPGSRANGPGTRTVFWVQGCPLGCPDCYNPATHDPRGGEEYETERLVEEVLSLGAGIEGISVSGGEPFQQPEALLDLLRRLAGRDLGRLVFSGYTLDEIRAMPLGTAILAEIDALIAGRYVASKRTTRGLLGSSNQRIHLLTDRYREADLAGVPPREVILHRDGSVTRSGISPVKRPDPGV